MEGLVELIAECETLKGRREGRYVLVEVIAEGKVSEVRRECDGLIEVVSEGELGDGDREVYYVVEGAS